MSPSGSDVADACAIVTADVGVIGVAVAVVVGVVADVIPTSSTSMSLSTSQEPCRR